MCLKPFRKRVRSGQENHQIDTIPWSELLAHINRIDFSDTNYYSRVMVSINGKGNNPALDNFHGRVPENPSEDFESYINHYALKRGDVIQVTYLKVPVKPIGKLFSRATQKTVWSYCSKPNFFLVK